LARSAIPAWMLGRHPIGLSTPLEGRPNIAAAEGVVGPVGEAEGQEEQEEDGEIGEGGEGGVLNEFSAENMMGRGVRGKEMVGMICEGGYYES
jgi:hypothetical protein